MPTNWSQLFGVGKKVAGAVDDNIDDAMRLADDVVPTPHEAQFQNALDQEAAMGQSIPEEQFINEQSQIAEKNLDFLENGPQDRKFTQEDLDMLQGRKPVQPQIGMDEPMLPVPSQGTSTIPVDDAQEAIFRRIDEKPGMSMAQKAGLGAAAAGGAAGLGYGAMKMFGGPGQPPTDNGPTPASIPGQSPAVETSVPPPVSAQTPITMQTQGAPAIAAEQASAPQALTPTELPPDPTQNTVQGMQQAIDDKNSMQLVNRLGRAGDLIGAGIAGQGAKPAAQDIFNEQIKAGEDKVKDFEQITEQEKNDPKSQISKDYRDWLRDNFKVNVPTTVSAATAMKQTPYAVNQFMAQEAQKARHEDRKLQYDQMKLAREDKLDAKKEDKAFVQTTKLRQEIDKQTKDVQDVYDQRNQMVMGLEDAIERGNKGGGKGFQDVAITYGFIKGRDNSAVREGEISILKNAGSISDRLRRNLNAALSGQAYNKDDMRALVDLLKNENKQLTNTYRKRVAPIIEQATKRGLSMEEVISRPDIYGETVEKGKDSRDMPAKDDNGAPGKVVKEQERFKTPGKSVVKKGYNPKTDQTQIVYSDGTKEIVQGKK